MRLETKTFLFDIQQAVNLVTAFIQGKSFTDYASDPMLRSAVERQLEIIGEALSKLVKADPAVAATISEHRRVIAFRNILVHGYAQVDHGIVWSILETKLPVMQREVEALLSAEV